MSAPGSDVRVCFVGDSFVAGLGDSTGLGWVGRVVNASHRRGLPLTTYNLGVRRDTSELILERLAREVAPRLAPAEFPRIVVSFGVNDTVLDNGSPRVSPAGSVSALRGIRTACGTTELMLVGPPAVDDEGQNERIRALSDDLRDEADRLGIPFLACFAGTVGDAGWRREVREGDGFHPDAAGYTRLAAFIEAPLLDWLAPRV